MIKLKKRIFAAALAAAALAGGTFTPAGDGASAAGSPRVAVFVNGARVEARADAVIIGAMTYVPFRDYSAALGAAGAAAGANGALRASAPGLTVEARAGDSYIVANGRYLYAPSGCIGAAGDVLVPLRALGRAFGAAITWNEVRREVYVRTFGNAAIATGDSFYNKEDVLWLSRIISAEARGEPMQGKIAVGNVVMNRKESPYYPNTVYGVIFDRRSGVQFTPAYSGAINCNPSPDCVIAAKIALDGGNTAGNSLFFASAYSRCWAASHRPFNGKIGNHNFYA
ncbi:MAG: cell wall hydrolase [Oscillospiraceae bacterium]|jgi:N-acetylmuramoyl-L-alanine amidase|nr:cell wall hydrolase [Oscillospiraceae bacterium]